jgi:hypothetical protein
MNLTFVYGVIKTVGDAFFASIPSLFGLLNPLNIFGDIILLFTKN